MTEPIDWKSTLEKAAAEAIEKAQTQPDQEPSVADLGRLHDLNEDAASRMPAGIQFVDLTQADPTDARIIRITDGARGNAAHDGELPTEAQMVINEAIREAWRTVEAGDEVTEETVAADIAQRLHDLYGVTATTRTPAVTPVQVYRTDDNREAVLVYEGGTQTGMRLMRQGAAIRIAYLKPDGTEPAPAGAEYAWYDGPLTLGRTI